MAIRKEQVLFLATLAFAAWMVSGVSRLRAKRGVVSTTAKEYVIATGQKPITVLSEGPKALRERFIEPSESRPLPPRDDLPFPPLQALPVVLLPLETGQHPAAYHGLRHPAFAAVDLAKAAAPGGKPNGEGEPAEVPAPGAGSSTLDNPTANLDELVMADSIGSKFPGLFNGTAEEKFYLGSRRGPYLGKTIRFQWINTKTMKTSDNLVRSGDNVAQLRLAKTLRNEVGMRIYLLTATNSNIQKQKDLIQWLLIKGQTAAWVYEDALKQAEVYLQFAKPAEEGLLWKAKVLRAMGDLPAEYKLFKDLDNHPTLKGSSFQFRGLGLVEAKLGLDKLAEQHLSRAVAISKPIDPRNYAALARFYLDRGRASEAVPHATEAVQYKTSRDTSDGEQVAIRGVLVAALLAVGDLEGAAQQVASPVTAEFQLQADYQSACVSYARKKFAEAEVGFQTVYNTGRVPDALLGVAAAQMGQGKFAESKANLEKVIDEQPRLRHLGYAGLGLLYSANGEQGEGNTGNVAIEHIEAGLAASPGHPYLLYLLGRQKRLNGDLDGAIEPLKKALRAHDDCLEALAELAVTHYALFHRNGDAQALVSALRYVDRLVALDQGDSGGKAVGFLEMQGRIHFEARDWRGARTAFETGDRRVEAE